MRMGGKGLAVEDHGVDVAGAGEAVGVGEGVGVGEAPPCALLDPRGWGAASSLGGTQPSYPDDTHAYIQIKQRYASAHLISSNIAQVHKQA